MSRNAPERDRNYDDIIHMPHHVSRKRPQMPLEDRAAQFSPFAAVVGHEASVSEAARLTTEKRDLDESEKSVINEQLQNIQSKIGSGMEVGIEHFEADALKSGGQYIVSRGTVDKIDVYTRCVHMSSGIVIAIDDIFQIVLL